MGLLINTITRTSYLTDCRLLSFMLCSNSELHLFVRDIPLCVKKSGSTLLHSNNTLTKIQWTREDTHFGFLLMPPSVNIQNLYRWSLITAVLSNEVQCKLCVCAYYKVHYSKLIFCKVIHCNIFIVNSFYRQIFSCLTRTLPVNNNQHFNHHKIHNFYPCYTL